MKIDKSTLPENMNIARIAEKTHIMTYKAINQSSRYPDKPLCGCKWDFVDGEMPETDELTCARCQKVYSKMVKDKGAL